MLWFKYLLKSFILPPGLFFLLVMIAILLRLNKKKLQSYLLLCFVLILSFLMSTPHGAYFIMSPLEENIVPLSNEKINAQAILILGGGQRKNAVEFESKTAVSSASLIRLSYGVVLYKRSALPILLSGGACLDDEVPEAKVMENTLREVFSIPAKWTEEKSQNTEENAKYSAEIFKDVGIKRVLLVTDAWHMRRALLAFKSTGLEIIPAPTNFLSFPQDPVLSWLPNAEAFHLSTRALHEWIGYIWYRIAIP